MKLHELLAIESNLETQSSKVRADLLNTFEKKRHLFEEKRTVFIPSAENETPVTETQSDLQSTVIQELQWIQGHLTKSLDASFQVADTNTRARADVVLEDEAADPLLKDIPATALLELEKRLAEVQTLIKSIPTLDPAKGFKADADRGVGVYVAREVFKTRTKKTPKVIVKYEATKEHPAQTEMVHEDVPVGKIQEQEWSGLITPATKAALLERVESVTRAVRRARSRANEAEVQTDKRIGKRLLDYIFSDL